MRSKTVDRMNLAWYPEDGKRDLAHYIGVTTMGMLDQISKKIFEAEFTVSKGIEVAGKKEKRVVTVQLTPLPLQIDTAAELCGGIEYLIAFAQLGRRNQIIVDTRQFLNAGDDVSKQLQKVINGLKAAAPDLSDSDIQAMLATSPVLTASIKASQDVALTVTRDGNNVQLPGKSEDSEAPVEDGTEEAKE